MASAKPSLFVLAGTNGAGKSSVIGAAVRESGLAFFNPDAIARKLADANPGLSQEEANGLAWREGLRLLDEQGPDHDKCFLVSVDIDGRRFGPCWARSKKQAEQTAARQALESLGLLVEDGDGHSVYVPACDGSPVNGIDAGIDEAEDADDDDEEAGDDRAVAGSAAIP